MREAILVPSLGILLFNMKEFFNKLFMLVLVPSLGILLFNHSSLFDAVITTVLVPSLGILLFNDTKAGLSEKKGRQFSSPLWGFFYLILNILSIIFLIMVLVPSLGILLFNPVLENSDKHLAILYVCA